jgi:hypothetical protein
LNKAALVPSVDAATFASPSSRPYRAAGGD